MQKPSYSLHIGSLPISSLRTAYLTSAPPSRDDATTDNNDDLIATDLWQPPSSVSDIDAVVDAPTQTKSNRTITRLTVQNKPNSTQFAADTSIVPWAQNTSQESQTRDEPINDIHDDTGSIHLRLTPSTSTSIDDDVESSTPKFKPHQHAIDCTK